MVDMKNDSIIASNNTSTEIKIRLFLIFLSGTITSSTSISDNITQFKFGISSL
jgi:hypothetical protein